MNARSTSRGAYHAADGLTQHREWLALVDVAGPFLSLPVLRATWPDGPDALDKEQREPLRRAHARWLDDTAAGQRGWIDFLLRDLLGWGEALHLDGLEPLAVEVAEHDTTITPSFALATPGEDVKPDTVRLLGLVCPAGHQPTARIPGSHWAATPVDRIAHACRHHDIQLGLVTDGRWWTLVWAPRGKATATATFDTVSWSEAAERVVVRAFLTLLGRRRFFGVPDAQTLVPLLEASLTQGEDITEALGVQVRQAVELLVAAIGRADIRDREAGNVGLSDVDAHEVYRGAVAVMMRIVFLLFAEERGLLPADNDLYASAYSAGRLCAELEDDVKAGSEEDLEHSTGAWHRLLALFAAVYRGIDHPRLRLHAHDGSLFDPDAYPWLPHRIDDRTVLHMLRAVQHVEVGRGRSRERRTVSFRTLDVEQIGYVYEGLLSFEGFRADDVVVGLIGKEGQEEEVHLTELESLAANHVDDFAEALAERYKDSKIGSARAVATKLKPLPPQAREEARKKLLAVAGGDYPLAERLLPFVGLIRTDLRDLPVVILPGALYVTESALRKNTGTHYTPRFLAEEVVEHALEPLVYEPGPLQTADRSQWKPRSSTQILALKVADIAMGSAAFLVAAARYLGEHLVNAWTREGDPRVAVFRERTNSTVDADEDPLVIEARRQIIEHCLYGADINPMAVEMAKLSLWLVSMDPQRPFTFLDDRLVTGDSLLGITSLEQLRYMHLDPEKGRAIHGDALLGTDGVQALVAGVAELRKQVTSIELGSEPLAALARKRALLEQAKLKTGQARLFADLAVGAALANARRGENGLRDASIAAADYARRILDNSLKAEVEAREQRRTWLATGQPSGAFDRDPLHWPLIFPEVFDNGGFDAIIGNPPFLGGKKLSGALGSSYRELLVNVIASGVKGNADLIAYFVLQLYRLISSDGQIGILGTNTLGQGDTREVGLDQLLVDGATIRRAVKSKPWPSKSAVLEYCAVWISKGAPSSGFSCWLDGIGRVDRISSSLDSESRVTGVALRLERNARTCFIGNLVNGIGFVVDFDEKTMLINEDRRSLQVLFPYLNGEDVNSRPGIDASRSVIDFRNWELLEAERFPACLDRVRRLVKPSRDRMPDAKRVTREAWWRFEKLAPGLRAAIAELDRVIVITLVSKTVMPVMVPTGQVFAHKLGVFASDDLGLLALLSSAPHYWWTVRRSSTMKTDINYSPSDVFETFALPEISDELRATGERLDTFRREVMLGRQLGLTKLYNQVFDPEVSDPEIDELRAIHRRIDEATVRAYGWDDLLEQGLDHGFHKVGRETRYTVGPAVQQEILDRLLELNHERYAEEEAQGLHDNTKKKAKKAAPRKAAPKTNPDALEIPGLDAGAS
ncbi:type IIL restriction-modification enzyme MmeI [Actinocatenispora sera]|uniref:Eco57I restriction-modification methylase domain-containing protein n=1 Tax=Actinocatenispora sera TaxID=390989 RepID=UPI0033F985E1